jgi:large subunit ribosomal protein L29
MKQSEIKDLSAALQEKLSLTKKTYDDLKWLMLYHQLKIHFKLEGVRTIARLATELTKELQSL